MTHIFKTDNKKCRRNNCAQTDVQMSCDFVGRDWQRFPGAKESLWPSFCLLACRSTHFATGHWLVPLGSGDARWVLTTHRTLHKHVAWCAFLLHATMDCTWTSSNIVACSWLVSVVKCFWSSNLVLEEFIPVEKREKDKGSMGESWVGFTTSQTHFLHSLTHPLQDPSIRQ